MASTASPTAPRSRRLAGSRRKTHQRLTDERVGDLHSQADCDVPADGRNFGIRLGIVSAAAGCRASHGRLPDDNRDGAAPGGEPQYDGFFGGDATGTEI